MILLTVISVLLTPFCISADSGNLDPSTVAEAFYQGVKAHPSLEPLFDTTLPAEEFYLGSLHTYQKLAVPNYMSHARNVKRVVERIFPKITPDKNMKLLTHGVANFLLDLGMVNEDNLHNLVDKFISSLQSVLNKSNGNRALLAMGGFSGVIDFLVSSGALISNNANDFLKPLFFTYLAEASGDNSSFDDAFSTI